MNNFRLTMILDTGHKITVNQVLPFANAIEVVERFNDMKMQDATGELMTIGFNSKFKSFCVTKKHIVCFEAELIATDNEVDDETN